MYFYQIFVMSVISCILTYSSLLIVVMISHFLWRMNIHVSVPVSTPGKCTKYGTELGTIEDMVRIPESSIFIGTKFEGDMYHLPNYIKSTSFKRMGHLVYFDVSSKIINYVKIENFPVKIGFHPHGINFSKGKLYVVNHAWYEGGDRIEIFKCSTSVPVVCNYVESIISDLFSMGGLNAVAVSDNGHVYTTNWLSVTYSAHGPTKPEKILNMFALAGGVHVTRIIKCIKREATYICEYVGPRGVSWNGLDILGDRLVAADCGNFKLLSARINETSGLSDMQYIELPHAVDNVRFGSDGLLRGGGIVRGIDFLKHVMYKQIYGSELFVPGYSFTVDLNSTSAGTSRYFSKSTLLGGVSFFDKHNDLEIFGSFYDKGILVCQ